MRAVVTTLGVACLALAALAVEPDAQRADPYARLVWHVEAADGEIVDSRRAGDPINPASVVKLATSLWALDRLGPDHRFLTRFEARGTLDASTGVLDGDLVVHGGGDPDFHVDNLDLVARAMNRAGVRAIGGRLLVDHTFWIGWEGGSERKTGDPDARVRTMATRLRDAFDPSRWDGMTRRSMKEVTFRRRSRGIEGPVPSVVVLGGVGRHSGSGPAGGSLVFEHRSNALRHLLKRFNAYSNNDIERLGASLGSAEDLASYVAGRFEQTAPHPEVATLSGLGVNRMTATQVVAVLRDLNDACERVGLDLDDVLAGVGCDPGTLKHLRGLPAGSVVGKTGTLVRTDGGVVALAGVARTGRGDRFFCVAEPRAGKRISASRRLQGNWLDDLFSASGGPRPTACGGKTGYSDDDARVVELRGAARAPEGRTSQLLESRP